jgi:hypothetical protein
MVQKLRMIQILLSGVKPFLTLRSNTTASSLQVLQTPLNVTLPPDATGRLEIPNDPTVEFYSFSATISTPVRLGFQHQKPGKSFGLLPVDTRGNNLGSSCVFPAAA